MGRHGSFFIKGKHQHLHFFIIFGTGNIEGQFAMVYKKLLVLSEQQIVDCDKRSHGCGGGYMNNAFR